MSLTPDLTFSRDLAAELAARPWLDAVSVYWRGVGPALIDAARVQRVLVLAWTVDHPHIAAHLLAQGVHGLINNTRQPGYASAADASPDLQSISVDSVAQAG